MSSLIRFFLIAAIATASITLSGCGAARPFVKEGNAQSVEVGYYGDAAATLPLARQYCAQFERVPQLAEASLDVAYYDCLRR